MSTLFVENTPEVDGWLARRRELGLDKKDEVWEGVYHVTPYEHARNGRVKAQLTRMLYDLAEDAGLVPNDSFNLGEPRDFRVPDMGFVEASEEPRQYMTTAALVVEMLSPGDETFAKFDFYAGHGVQEVWVVDPLTTSVRIWQLREDVLTETGRSDLLGLTAASVAQRLVWPRVTP
ncbi:MAG: Uma2 family endonuclease [Actinomycetes bacterium]